MQLWWESLTLLQKVFVTLAVPSTLILILQSLMTLFGLAGGSGVDLDGDIPDDVVGGDMELDSAADSVDGNADTGSNIHSTHSGAAHHSSLSLFTVRGVTAFFAVGGWTGLTLTSKQIPAAIAVIIALIAGAAALVGIAYIFMGILLLQDSGNVEPENAVGKTAQVYLTIPESNRGKGKVTLVVQEKYLEFDACTRSGSPIKTGETVHVVDLLDDNTLVVEQTIFNKDPNLVLKK